MNKLSEMWARFTNRVKGWFGLRMYGSGYRRGLRTGVLIQKRWGDK